MWNKIKNILNQAFNSTVSPTQTTATEETLNQEIPFETPTESAETKKPSRKKKSIPKEAPTTTTEGVLTPVVKKLKKKK